MRRAGTRFGFLVVAAVGAVLAVMLVSTPAALAHVPTLEQPRGAEPTTVGAAPYSDAQAIQQPSKSLAIYGFLARDERSDAYVFSVPQAATIEVELLVPARAALRDFAPVLLVVDAKTNESQKVSPASRDSFYEPFSLTSFWRVGQGSVSLQAGRTYYFVVQPGTGSTQTGAYVIGVGGPEAFTGNEWAETLRDLPIIWSGAWGGGPPRSGALACVGAAVLGIVLAVLLLVRRRRRRQG
jgi:hypothetical protein